MLQVRREMTVALTSIPLMSLLTTFVFLAEVRGHSLLRDNFLSIPEELASVFGFLVFTDFWIYWIHRGLHHPLVCCRPQGSFTCVPRIEPSGAFPQHLHTHVPSVKVYPTIHKTHHLWKIPTPW